ncbi:MAG TPA: TonB-dependent receptor [Candidatus Baltobacteraceae bacterium]|nr:TonB-dependent receptor [Candidatus Baltobacteraceae bacterium]
MIRRVLSLFTILSLLCGAVPALAQSDTGEIDIVVQKNDTKAPVALARVMLDGPVITSEFTGDNGKVRFTEVPDGIYRARVSARGYQMVTSENFEVTNGRVVTVTVALAVSQTSGLRTIASVTSKSTATVTTNTVDSNSAQRKLSDTLADALGKLSGVNVSTSSSDSDATQTVSLEGQDASQTALSLDGIPLNAPGTAGNLRAIGTDLFTRSSVSFGPQIGGLAGGVNFNTLSPTLSWQSQFSLSAGSYGKNNYSFGETGTVGKFGIAVMHSYRLSPSLLDGQTFLDTSGLDYSHDGDSQAIGSMIKLRYQPSESQTLTGTFMHSVNGSQLICAQLTGPLPCGYGPGNSFGTTFNMYSLADSALIGETQFQFAAYGFNNNSTRNELDRYVAGVAEPTGSSSTMNTQGFSLNAILPSRDRHTISVNAYTSGTSSAFTPLVASAAPYIFGGQKTRYSALTINDSIRANTKLRFNDSVGVSQSSNASSSVLLGVGTQWSPTTSDSYALSYNVGGNGAGPGRFGVLSDPSSLRFTCNNGDVAYGNAPGDEPAANSSTSTRLSYTHKARFGQTSLSFYRQTQRDVVLPTQVNGSVLAAGGIFPPGYFDNVYNNFVDACGNPLPFTPSNVSQYTYFSTPIGGVQRVYEGAQLSGFYQLGNLVLQPFYNIQVAKAISGDVRLNNPYSITIPGSQLPNVPLHRAGITLDYKAPRSAVEWLADANYTGANNQQNLPAYTTVDAGVNLHLERGDLTLAASNIFNTYSGTMASSQWAVPYTTLGGTQIPTIARPNSPQQISLTYTVRFGQNVQPAAASPLLSQREGEGPGGPGGGRGGFRGAFGAPLPSTPPADPFAINTTPLCTADAQKTAKPLLDSLKAYTQQIESLKKNGTYPQTVPAASIPGVNVTYHPMGTTYALSLALTQTAQMRPIFGCTTFHAADLQTAQQRNLYVAPSAGAAMFFRPTVNFMPSVGLYFVRRPPQAGAESFRLYALPAAPPKTPFELHNVGTLCTAEMHAAAQTALSQLQAHFASNAAAPAWTITPHTASGGTWYALEPSDIGSVPAILNCGRVAAAARDDLAKKGLDGANAPSLNYSPALGLYLVRPQPRNGQGGPGGGPGGPPPGASPSPAPSASP